MATIKQLSIFLENKPGHLKTICGVLAEAGVNILTLSIADTEQFGILRMIIPEWENARRILEARGFVVHANEVVAVEVEDKPGGMAQILNILDKDNLNVEYAYAFTFRRKNSAVLIFRFNDTESAVGALQTAGRPLLAQADLLEALER